MRRLSAGWEMLRDRAKRLQIVPDAVAESAQHDVRDRGAHRQRRHGVGVLALLRHLRLFLFVRQRLPILGAHIVKPARGRFRVALLAHLPHSIQPERRHARRDLQRSDRGLRQVAQRGKKRLVRHFARERRHAGGGRLMDQMPGRRAEHSGLDAQHAEP